ncbi:8577_t:CDS:2 [Ambispora gerdemannii]|uniref:8577_t:CDS:1 n=1 Tax=Ambispora gerdemannii TaxID=144530 RepID=A0A9N9AJS8_9GLOM|nr:8577_t:CDS:2 [Ambispora gerdemannii]
MARTLIRLTRLTTANLKIHCDNLDLTETQFRSQRMIDYVNYAQTSLGSDDYDVDSSTINSFAQASVVVENRLQAPDGRSIDGFIYGRLNILEASDNSSVEEDEEMQSRYGGDVFLGTGTKRKREESISDEEEASSYTEETNKASETKESSVAARPRKRIQVARMRATPWYLLPQNNE